MNYKCKDKEFLDLLKKYRNQKGNLIPLLQKAQEIYGYLSRECMEKIALATNKKLSEVYGVATFYTQFRLTKPGRNIIKVCHGTACHVGGAQNITWALCDELKIKEGEVTPDGKYSLESVACLGCCSLAPVMMINEDTFGRLTNDEARKIVRTYKEKDDANE